MTAADAAKTVLIKRAVGTVVWKVYVQRRWQRFYSAAIPIVGKIHVVIVEVDLFATLLYAWQDEVVSFIDLAVAIEINTAGDLPGISQPVLVTHGALRIIELQKGPWRSTGEVVTSGRSHHITWSQARVCALSASILFYNLHATSVVLLHLIHCRD